MKYDTVYENVGISIENNTIKGNPNPYMKF